MGDKIDKALTQLVLRHPFYACIALQSPVVRVNSEWMTANAGFPALGATDGVRIIINTDRLDEIGTEETVGLFKHEVEHMARLHSYRQGARDRQLWNQACDHVINLSILDAGESLPEEGLADERFRGMAEERVYTILLEDKAEGKQGQGGDGDGDGMDALLPPPSDFSSTDAQRMKERVHVAAAVAKAQGNLPGHMRSLLDDLAPPSKNWEHELQEFLTDSCALDYSWAKVNRLFVSQSVYLPGRDSIDSMGPLAIIIDTSGSVSDDELRQYFGDLCAAVEAVHPLRLHVIYVDADVSKVEEFDEPSDADVRAVAGRSGGGGTDMTVGLRWVEENIPDVTAAIVFTDGDTPFGQPMDFPTLWAISGRAEASWGRTVTLPTGRAA